MENHKRLLIIILFTIIIISAFGFEQFEFTMGNEYKIPAALTIPKDKETFPLVMIVQGSGEAGIDNVVGENATIRDIAYELSKNGIATFRYAKRNGLYPEDFKLFTSETLKMEYLEDAQIAMESVLKVPGVKEIYLLGLSMGGYILPEIADLLEARFDISIRGLILCASGIAKTPAPLVMFEQIKYQMETMGFSQEQIMASKKTWEELCENKLNEKTVIHPTMTAGYVYSIMKSDPYSRLKNADSKVLVIQGDADRINAVKFFHEFKRDFKDKNDQKAQFEFMLFSEVNHRLMIKEYDDLYTDLMKKGVVDPRIIEGIVEWIKSTEEALEE